jgi:hypothetical protein
MKIQFEGSMTEFQALFSGTAMFAAQDTEGFEDEEEAEGQVRTFPVHKGGREPTEEVERPAHDQPGVQPDGVGVNPLSNDMPVPMNDPRVGKELDLPELSDEEREVGWAKFKEVCVLWAKNFGVTEEAEVIEFQPLRNDDGALVDEEGKVLTSGAKAIQVETKVLRQMPAPQPDREAALREMGEGRYPRSILVMAYEIGSLQRLVQRALAESEAGQIVGFELDYVDQIAMNMVQVSHKAFPDIAGTYDHSTRWRRFEPPSARRSN